MEQEAFWRKVAQTDDKHSAEIEWRYGEMYCPTTIPWGEVDNWIFLADGPELAQRMNAPFTTVPKA